MLWQWRSIYDLDLGHVRCNISRCGAILFLKIFTAAEIFLLKSSETSKLKVIIVVQNYNVDAVCIDCNVLVLFIPDSLVDGDVYSDTVKTIEIRVGGSPKLKLK